MEKNYLSEPTLPLLVLLKELQLLADSDDV
jgi:hypothetical protein